MKTTITLNMIRAHSPCEDGWSTLLASLGKTDAARSAARAAGGAAWAKYLKMLLEYFDTEGKK